MTKENLDENEKCQTSSCDNLKEWKFTFLKAGKQVIEELCSDCVEATIDDRSKRYISLEEVERPKVYTMKRR